LQSCHLQQRCASRLSSFGTGHRDDKPIHTPAEDEVRGFVAACLLMVRGQLARRTEDERAGRSLHEWAVEQLGENSAIWLSAIQEVIAMEPDERGAYIIAATTGRDA
jgi:hypothetical protein